MKHPVSVSELLELHALGELFVKWVSNPVSMSEEEVEKLQEVSDKYSINSTSALFSFQKQFHQEFGLTSTNTLSIHEVAKEVLAIADAKAEIRYEEKLITNSVEDTDVLEAVEDQYRAPAEMFEVPTGAEMDEALAEQLREDSEVDRKAEAQYRADQLRDALVEGGLSANRELEILREISNVDELTFQEGARLDELVRKLNQDSGTHRIPTGVLAQAVGGSEKGNK